MAKRQHAVNTRKTLSRSPAGDAFSGFVIAVLRLAGLLGTAGDALAKPAGQTSARWQVLAAIETGPSTVAQIARGIGLARQSVQRVADLLERDGLSAYEENPADLRAEVLRLTARGRSALTTIQDAQRSWADEIGTRIGEHRLRRATALLKEAMEILSDLEKPSK